MKKQTLFSIIFIAVLIIFSMVFTSAVFAGNITHTITIDNQSNYTLIKDNTSHVVIYNSSNSTCATVPPDTCGTVNMTPPSEIPAKTSKNINMTGPAGCNISAWQSFYKPGKGNVGTIRCTMSPVNVCNSITPKNYKCTITQGNADTAKGGSNVTPVSQ